METLNLILLTLHNITRWAVLILAIIVIVRAFRGWFGKREYESQDKKFASIYTGIFDLQILIGVILGPLLERYFLLALKKSDGDVLVLFSSTIGNILWVALVASLALPIVLQRRRNRVDQGVAAE